LVNDRGGSCESQAANKDSIEPIVKHLTIRPLPRVVELYVTPGNFAQLSIGESRRQPASRVFMAAVCSPASTPVRDEPHRCPTEARRPAPPAPPRSRSDRESISSGRSHDRRSRGFDACRLALVQHGLERFVIDGERNVRVEIPLVFEFEWLVGRIEKATGRHRA
jgi:hypothetical protein